MFLHIYNNIWTGVNDYSCTQMQHSYEQLRRPLWYLIKPLFTFNITKELGPQARYFISKKITTII